MNDYMTYLDGPLGVLLAGVGGAALLLCIHSPPTFRARVAAAIAGVVTAFFVAPAIVAHWFHGAPYEDRLLVAFVVGCLGPILAAAGVRAVERRADALADRLVNRVAGNDNGRESEK